MTDIITGVRNVDQNTILKDTTPNASIQKSSITKMESANAEGVTNGSSHRKEIRIAPTVLTVVKSED